MYKWLSVFSFAKYPEIVAVAFPNMEAAISMILKGFKKMG